MSFKIKNLTHILTTVFLVGGLMVSMSSAAVASITVAVVDSGTDFDHDLLKDKVWTNPGEIPGNMIDDDHNGKVDDVHGWNFAEGYNRFFFPEHIAQVSPITYKIFEVIAARQANHASQEQLTFWAKNVVALNADQKAELLTHLNWYGEYAHSTHCSGIIVQRNPDVKLISDRIFPDTQPNIYQHPIPQSGSGLSLNLVGINEALYWLAATVTDQIFGQVAPYLAETKARVANYSIGVGLETIVKAVLALRGNQNPSQDELSAEVKKAYVNYEANGKKWMASAPDTLFVVASGNDGADTDRFPAYPASIRVENEISVAATQGFSLLASFSNYGKTTVDVAAPGVAIMSSVPGPTSDMMLPLSGTSMATPYVTGVASAVLSANPALKPGQVRAILMGTVDKKDWLVDKVVSAGIVNQARAVDAAEKAKTVSLDEAIADSRKEVPDQIEKSVQLNSGLSFVEPTQSFADLDYFAQKVVF
jgi:subtilisin family serine protease